MAEEQNLEATIHKNLVSKEGVIEAGKAIPPIFGCTGLSYLIGMADCVQRIAQNLPNGLNVGYHLAAGSGIYGGYASSEPRRAASLITLAASFVPDVVLLTQHANGLKQVAVSAGVKIAGYGIGYVLGRIFRE